MVRLEALHAVRTIVVHDDCSDGLASALLLHDALPAAAVRFVQYGTAHHRHLIAEPGLLFCDLSPPAERAEEFRVAGALVLDHHRSVRDLVAQFGERGVFGDEDLEPGVSGAVLAFRHAWLPLRAGDPIHSFADRLATLAGIRDTWQTRSPSWAEACIQHHALRSVANDDWLGWSLPAIAAQWASRFAGLGRVVMRRQEEQISRLLAGAYRFKTHDGARVLAFNGLGLVSDAAEAARAEADIVIGIGLEVEADVPILRVSVRSNSVADVSALAARFGGGGHRAAAGFSLTLPPIGPHPFALLERLLNDG